MADNLSKVQRSFAMSRIRSTGNKTTEQALIALMRTGGVRGWRRNIVLPGRPDFVFPKLHVAVFVDGCYWHGCPKCELKSKSNLQYWGPKIAGNIARDKRNARWLREAGWKVVRIWEHDLKTAPLRALRKIQSATGEYKDLP